MADKTDKNIHLWANPGILEAKIKKYIYANYITHHKQKEDFQFQFFYVIQYRRQ